MSSDSWLIGLNGNWSDASDWTNGVPTLAADVVINASNTYTVTISRAAFANSISLTGAGAALSETATGTLGIPDGVFIGSGSTAILRGANIITGDIAISAATVEIANAAALGTTEVLADGALVALINLKLENQISLCFSTVLAAAHGKALALANGDWINPNLSTVLTLGTGSNDGSPISAKATDPVRTRSRKSASSALWCWRPPVSEDSAKAPTLPNLRRWFFPNSRIRCPFSKPYSPEVFCGWQQNRIE
jgi:hypothetical protein